MEDDDPQDLDALTRDELADLDGPAHTVAQVLDEWNHRLHGVTSSAHGAGLFLDLLAAEGWRVTPIAQVLPLDDLLSAPEGVKVSHMSGVSDEEREWARRTVVESVVQVMSEQREAGGD